MKVYECKAIKVEPYTYKLIKHAGKETRVCAFAGQRPPLWAFLCGCVARREQAVGIPEPAMLPGKTLREGGGLILTTPGGRFAPEGKELAWDAMPDNVREAVRVFGGKMFTGRCMDGRQK